MSYNSIKIVYSNTDSNRLITTVLELTPIQEIVNENNCLCK